MTDNAPGWQADPTGRHDHRYWDGTAWTDNVSDAGVASTDAYVDSDVTVADAAAGDATAEAEAPGWADPTTTLPTASADPTSIWPTTPAPPPPPSYTPPMPPAAGPIGPAGTGASKKGLFIGMGVLAAVAIVVALLLMGGGDDGEDIRAQLAAQFRANSDLSGDQADCVADHVVDEMGADSFEDVDFSADEPPEAIADELFTAAASSLEACDIDPADFAGAGEGDEPSGEGDTYGSDPELDALYDACEDGDYQACDDLYDESPSGSEYEEFADTCGERNEPSGYCVDIYEGDGGDDDGGLSTDGELPANFEQQLADIYEDSLGLSQEQAECLAGKLADAVSSGDLSEEEAFSDVFEFLSECDIDPSEISGD